MIVVELLTKERNQHGKQTHPATCFDSGVTMSTFYQSMDLNKELNMHFKAMKRAFKQGQACANCHRKLKKHLMTVDHIIPVSDPSVDPFDMTNWQVLCMPCHRKKSHKENLARRAQEIHASVIAEQERHKDIKQGIVT